MLRAGEQMQSEKGLNFLPLINQHADTYTKTHKMEQKYCCFLMPIASDPDTSVSLNERASGKTAGFPCLHLNSHTECCTLFHYIPFSYIISIKGYFQNQSSCKKLQDMEFFFLLLSAFLFPSSCYVKVCSSVSQGTGQEMEQLHQEVYQ